MWEKWSKYHQNAQSSSFPRFAPIFCWSWAFSPFLLPIEGLSTKLLSCQQLIRRNNPRIRLFLSQSYWQRLVGDIGRPQMTFWRLYIKTFTCFGQYRPRQNDPARMRPLSCVSTFHGIVKIWIFPQIDFYLMERPQRWSGLTLRSPVYKFQGILFCFRYYCPEIFLKVWTWWD